MNKKKQTTELSNQEISSISRRNFLSNAALAGAGLVISKLDPKTDLRSGFDRFTPETGNQYYINAG
jgi:hypothetical protein